MSRGSKRPSDLNPHAVPRRGTGASTWPSADFRQRRCPQICVPRTSEQSNASGGARCPSERIRVWEGSSAGVEGSVTALEAAVQDAWDGCSPKPRWPT